MALVELEDVEDTFLRQCYLLFLYVLVPHILFCILPALFVSPSTPPSFSSSLVVCKVIKGWNPTKFCTF